MRWVINSLPDGLWLFALLSYIKLIWYNDSQMLRNGWILVVLLGTLLTEFAQYFGVISGTFDVSDILTYVSAFLLYLTIDHKNRFNLKTI